MLEKVALQLLNRFIGAYVENLDASNLKLGLFSGNVVIEDLRVRENALDDFGLPFRIKVGHLGRLALTVPWKTMLTSSDWSGSATLDDVYLVLVPRAAVKFDAEKEQKERYDAKCKQLEQIESTIASRLEVADTDTAGKKTDKANGGDSWMDKLVADCVRNFQVVVRNIHVRFEDAVSNPSTPFACGVSFTTLSYNVPSAGKDGLSSLQWQDGPASVLPQAGDTRICTQLALESFAAYIEPESTLWSLLGAAAAIKKMRSAIVSTSQGDGLYVLRPLRVHCGVWIDMRPAASNYSRAMLQIACRLPSIDVQLTRVQYVATMSTLCELQRVLVQSRYVRYVRPERMPDEAKSSRQWWNYAYRVVLHEKVKRKGKKWKWDALRTHLRNCRTYKSLYMRVLGASGNTLSRDEQQILTELTLELDPFNVVRLRQQAAIDVAKGERERQKRSWSSYLWGSSKPASEPAAQPLIDVLSDEEKAQLRHRFESGSLNLDTSNAPRSFVKLALYACLDQLTVQLCDGSVQLATLRMRDLSSSLLQRAAANSLSVTVQLRSLAVVGVQDACVMQSLDTHASFIAATLETNPPQCEQLNSALRVMLRPAKLVAEAATVNAVIRFATLPNSIVMRKAFGSQSTVVKQSSVSALLRKRYRSDLSVEVEPWLLLVPADGRYQLPCAVLALSSGRLTLRNVPLSEEELACRAALQNDPGSLPPSDALLASVYDSYAVNLNDVQCVVARPGEQHDVLLANYDTAINRRLFAPISMHVELQQCVLLDDARFAQNRIHAQLQLLRIAANDATLRQMLAILCSLRQQLLPATGMDDVDAPSLRRIPSAESNIALDEDDHFFDAIAQLGREADADSISVSSGIEDDADDERNRKRRRLALMEEQRRRDAENVTQLAVSFALLRLELAVTAEDQPDAQLSFELDSLRSDFIKRPFDEAVSVQVGGFALLFRDFGLLRSNAQPGDATLKLAYRRVNEDAPSFVQVHERTAKRIDLQYDSLDIALHRERVADAATFLLRFYVQLTTDMARFAAPSVSTSSPSGDSNANGIATFVSADARNTISLRLQAAVRQLAVHFADERGTFSSLQLGRFGAQLSMQLAIMRACVTLGHVTLQDTCATRYPDLLALDANKEPGQDASQLMKIAITLNDTALANRLHQNGVKLFPNDIIVSDCDVQLAISRVRFVYLQPVLNRIVQSLDALQTPLNRMQREMRAASQKIAKQAQTLQLAERIITLDAQFDAPVVEVPRAADSDSRIVLDLGRMSVRRTYQPDADSQGHPTGRLSNTVRVALTNMQLAAESRLLLQPVSFVFQVTMGRTLLAGQLVPTTRLDARLNEVYVTLHDRDTVLLAAVYQQNVSTYTQLFNTVASSDASAPQSIDGDGAASDIVLADETNDATTNQGKTIDSATAMQVDIHVEFDQLTVALHSGNEKIAQSGQLARFELAALSLDASVTPDALMTARLSAARWSLDDLRIAASQPAYEGITRLLQNTGSSDANASRDLFVFQVAVTPDKQVDAQVDIDNLSLCASIDFINALLAYNNALIQPLSTLSSSTKTSRPSAQPVRAPKPTATATSKSTSAESLQLSARFQLNASQLALVERIDNKASNALVLCFETHGDLRLASTADKRQAFNCVLKLTDLLCCPYEPAARANRTTRVLNPVSISFIFNRSDEPVATRINLETDEFVLHVSPALIRFAGATLAAVVGSTQRDTPQSNVEIAHPHEDVLVPVGFWKCRELPTRDSINSSDHSSMAEGSEFWYLRNKSVEEVAVEVLETSELLATVEQLMINIPRVVVNLEEVIDASSTVPVLSIETSLRGELRDWSLGMRANVSCTLSVAYYNDLVGFWEPLLEPFELADSTFVPFSFDIKLQRNEQRPPVAHSSHSSHGITSDSATDISDDEDAAIYVCLTSPQSLNLTFTDANIRLLLRTAQQFSSAFKMQSQSHSHLTSADANFFLHNDSGASLVLALDASRFRVLDPPTPTVIPAGFVLHHGAALSLRDLSATETRLRAPPGLLRADSKELHLRKLTGGISPDALVTYSGVAAQRNPISFSVSLFNAAQNVTALPPTVITLTGCCESKVLELTHTNAGNLSQSGSNIKQLASWRKQTKPAKDAAMQPAPKLLGVHANVTLQRTEVRLRSAVLVRNELPQSVTLSLLTHGQSARVWTSLAPQAEAYLPIADISPDTSVCFAPARYNLSDSFKVFERTDKIVSCSLIEDTKKQLVAKVCARFVRTDLGVSSSLTGMYTYALKPLIRVSNLLPVALSLTQDMHATTVKLFAEHPNIESGRSVDLCDVPFSKMQLEICFVYRGIHWCAPWLPVPEPEQITSLKFRKADGSDKTMLTLTLHCEYLAGVLNATLCATYWLLNKTGLDLVYQFQKAGKDSARRVEQAASMREPIILSAKEKWLRKETVSFAVNGTDCGFCEPFSLDAVGTSGKVECKQKDGRVYYFGVKVELSATQLTKIITVTPYFVVLNNLDRTVRLLDSTGSKGTMVNARDVAAFWPEQWSSTYRLSVEVPFQRSEILQHADKAIGVINEEKLFVYSPVFALRESTQSVFRLSDAGAMSVDVRAADDSVTVVLSGYRPGLCPLYIVNDTKQPFFVRQAKAERFLEIAPSSAVMFALADSDLPRAVEWTHEASQTRSADSIKTCELSDSASVCEDGSFVQMCFMDGPQRVMLFTSSEYVLRNIVRGSRAMRPQFDVVLRLNAVGLSLVDTAARREILYTRVFSRGVLWRKRKPNKTVTKPGVGKPKENRLHQLDAEFARRLEVAYQKFVNTGRRSDLAVFKYDDVEVDFASSPPVMRKPQLYTLKRSDEPGVWVQLRSNSTHTELQAKIQLLQVDNPLPNSQFGTLFAVVPPRSTSGEEYQQFLTRPFFELSLVLDKQLRANVMQFHFLKFLIQESFVRVDRSIIVALLSFAAQLQRKQTDSMFDFQLDDAKNTKPLRDMFFDEFGGGGTDQIHYFGLLHLSPIKLDVSIALSGERDPLASSTASTTTLSSDQDEQNSAVDKFLRLTGISVVDASDVLLKLAYFERSERFYTQAQLIREIQTHYVRIAMRQLLKFVLGLDVLGNPYGVMRDLQRGVEDLFYEPVNGAMEGPREFVQGMRHGVTSLVKNTVGGVAGGVSKFTGALGKALASMTFDEEFKRERAKKLREGQSQGVPKNLATGAANIVKSVGQAAAGVITKPIQGAKQTGAVGFFKGIGKGLVGLVAVPTSVIADAASSALQSVQRVTESDSQVERVRLPRYFGPRSPLRAYLTREAVASSILALKELSNEVPFIHDEYVFHATLTAKPNFESMMIVTDLRAILITRDIQRDASEWRTNLTFWFDEMDALPSWVAPSGAKFTSRDEKLAANKQVTPKSGVYTLVLQFEDAHLGQYLVAVIQQILRRKYGFK